MLVVHFRGLPVREPDPWSGCRLEEEAREPAVSYCNFCGAPIALTDTIDWCNDACREADAEHAASDARADLEDAP
jgi:hypothetical protein